MTSSVDSNPFAPFARKMRAEGLPALAIAAFERHYGLVRSGETGLMPSSSIAPVGSLPDAEDLSPRLVQVGQEALAQTVILKLNGGLGTSMGLEKAKSLLTVKGDATFLDLIARQAGRSGCPLVLMNSFSTHEDSMRALERYPELNTGLPQAFLQHKVPKIEVATLQPVEWPDPEDTWCPPGHGDLYTALVTSGVLAALRGAGKRTAFVSNADNLGAILDLSILGAFVEERMPFLMEVADRTEADRKGGHLALQGEQLVLREAAQCPAEDLNDFQDFEKYRFFNTNTIWLDLDALHASLEAHGGVFPMPLIRNSKTVDPRDRKSTPVYQLESAMGAAISLFPGARAVRVPRARFAPVKTCADLLRVRSDATQLTDDFSLIPAPDAAVSSVPIELDSEFYSFVTDLDARFPAGPPSLVDCTRLKVTGDVHFGAGVRCVGEVVVSAEKGASLQIADGTVLGG